MLQYLYNFDIIGLNETWSDFKGEFDDLLYNYRCFDDVRSNLRNIRNSGGICVFVKDTLLKALSVRQIFNDFKNCVLLYLHTSHIHATDIIMCFTYISPEGSTIYNDSDEKNGVKLLENCLVTVRDQYPHCSLYIAGDCNARCKNLLDYIPDDTLDPIFGDVPYEGDNFDKPRQTKDNIRYNSFGQSLVDLCCLLNVHMLNGRTPGDEHGEFTCTANDGCSLVDYNIVSTELFDKICRFRVEDRDESDHFPLACKMQFRKKSNSHIDSEHNLRLRNSDENTTKFIWSTRRSETFISNFTIAVREQREHIITLINTSVDAGVNALVNIYQSAADCMRIRNRQSRTDTVNQNAIWWDAECETMKSHKYALLRIFRATDNRADLQAYTTYRNQFKNICKTKRLAYEVQQRSVLVSARNNPTKFWKHIKMSRDQKTQLNAEILSNDWFDYFGKLFSFNADQDFEFDLDTPTAANAQSLNDPFTEQEVTTAIHKLKVGKTPGPDGLAVEFFKNTCNESTNLLTQIFNAIFDTGIFPKIWGQSIICPIHKQGSRDDPNNYRAISLINAMSKIFASAMNTRLTKWANDYDIIDESQAGFRQGYSTIDNIFILQAMVQKYLSKQGGRFYCLFVDFSKAFDRVQHDKLLTSLQIKGIGGKYLRALRAMYGSLSSCVRSQDGLTDYFPCRIGTRQGCVSSPLLFSLFINDLATLLRDQCGSGIFINNDIPEIINIMFADDIANGAETVFKLQQQINVIAQFCLQTGMQINTNKTKVIVFRNGGILRSYETWSYQSTPLEVVPFYKYLGILFTPKLIWTRAKDSLAAQARKSVMAISGYQRKFGYFHHQDKFKLFDAMVKPVLCYGAEVWGYEISDRIEAVHTSFCKSFLGLSRNVNNSMALGECGRYPLCTTYLVKCVAYWCRLLHMQTFRYPRNCYLMLKSHDDVGRVNWASKIKHLLFMYGFGFVWISQDVGDTTVFLNQFKQRIIDCCKQTWHSEIEYSSKCLHYKHFKTLLDVERYITCDLPFHLRHAMSVFRCSNHKLNIEVGRHVGIQRDLRTCTYCLTHANKIVLEDEYHAFFECFLYSDIRQQHLPRHLYSNTSVNEFYRLISSDNQNTIKIISNYIYLLLKRRNTL